MRLMLDKSVRFALAGLFLVALVSKLRDPSQLLGALRNGLGLSAGGAGAAFVGTAMILSVLAALLLLRRGAVGLILASAFFGVGAVYAMTLQGGAYEGSCGCGIAPGFNASDPLVTHAWRNTACAVLCATLGFRALPGKGTDDETEEAALD